MKTIRNADVPPGVYPASDRGVWTELLREELLSLCHKAGVNCHDVRQVDVDSNSVTFHRYARNSDGHKFLDGEGVAVLPPLEMRVA